MAKHNWRKYSSDNIYFKCKECGLVREDYFISHNFPLNTAMWCDKNNKDKYNYHLENPYIDFKNNDPGCDNCILKGIL
jgi:hypothetical protein